MLEREIVSHVWWQHRRRLWPALSGSAGPTRGLMAATRRGGAFRRCGRLRLHRISFRSKFLAGSSPVFFWTPVVSLELLFEVVDDFVDVGTATAEFSVFGPTLPPSS